MRLSRLFYSQQCAVAEPVRSLQKTKRRVRPVKLPAEPEESKEEVNVQKTVSIEGMMCMHCVAHVKKALEALDGITEVEVSLESKQAVLTGTVSEAAVRAAVSEAGYEVTGIE